MAPRPNEPRAGSFPAPEQPVLAAPSISKPLAFVQPSSVAQGAAAGPSSVQKPAGQPLLSLPAFDGALHLAGRYDELLSLVSATRVANRAPAGFGRKYEYHVAPLSAFTAQPCAEGINVHFLHTTRKQDDWCYNCDAAGKQWAVAQAGQSGTLRQVLPTPAHPAPISAHCTVPT